MYFLHNCHFIISNCKGVRSNLNLVIANAFNADIHLSSLHGLAAAK